MGNDFFFLFKEIPMVGGTVFIEKSSSGILNFTKLNWVIILVVTEKFLSISTIFEIFINLLLNLVSSHRFRPSFKQDKILNVFKYLIINMFQISGTPFPNFSILRIVVAGPNIISSVSFKFLLFDSS